MCKGQLNIGKKPQVVQRQSACPKSMTVQEVREQIPAHYFKQNTAKSMYYLTRDIVQSIVTAAAMYYFVLPMAQSTGSQLVVAGAWAVFQFVQGLNWTALWVLAHECGHRGFSPSNAVNDTVGMLLHSALLVPYHSWRFSHSTHHKNTNHIFQDTVFVPRKRRTSAAAEAIEESPLSSLINIAFMLLLGWPMYLFFNMSGQKYNRRVNHFDPTSPLFAAGDRHFVVQSDIGIGAVVTAIVYSVWQFGAANVMCWYFIPYLWVNFWLVFITYLQHTDYRLPHYNADEWTFVRGALSTVDRDFGPVLNWWLHHINDSHVVHHLFSNMPFYNAIEVTRKHIKPILGEYYVCDDRPLAVSLWDSFRNCKAIVPSEGVAYYK